MRRDILQRMPPTIDSRLISDCQVKLAAEGFDFVKALDADDIWKTKAVDG